MPTYERADADAHETCARILAAFHKELRDAGVKVDLVFAHGKKDEHGHTVSPAIKHRGYPANGLARIIGLKDRAMGRGDCEIVIDGDQWPTWSEATRAALLDHELSHFKCCYEDGALVRDDLNRPKLAMRLHDIDVGWFIAVAERHRADSFECKQAESIYLQHAQLLFPFAAPAAAASTTTSTAAKPRKKRLDEFFGN